MTAASSLLTAIHFPHCDRLVVCGMFNILFTRAALSTLSLTEVTHNHGEHQTQSVKVTQAFLIMAHDGDE